ncbi:MAG: hypothetical protein GY710_04795 [Desulfobacteraceae bacterium]|nr:hypothetical protein [Desulfobacteraceae bacterium]
MKRFGIEHISSKKMDAHYLFLMRLHLLIVMAKARLKGYPLGCFRKEAVLENAINIAKIVPHLNVSFLELNTSSYLFKERVQLLSIMARQIVGADYSLGSHRRQAIIENIEIIIQMAFPRQKLSLFHDVLMVA